MKYDPIFKYIFLMLLNRNPLVRIYTGLFYKNMISVFSKPGKLEPSEKVIELLEKMCL